MGTVECDHNTGFCDEEKQQSGCSECDVIRPRCDCGEWDEATEALDRLGVAIHADHAQQSPERQWRLVAAEMAMLLSDAQLESIRTGHYDRVNPSRVL